MHIVNSVFSYIYSTLQNAPIETDDSPSKNNSKIEQATSTTKEVAEAYIKSYRPSMNNLLQEFKEIRTVSNAKEIEEMERFRRELRKNHKED